MRHKHLGAKYKIKPWGKYYVCDSCGQEFQSLKRRIANFLFWKWRFYCGRGEMFISDLNGLVNVMGGLGVILLLIDRQFGVMPGGQILVYIWAFQKALVYYLGYMDFWHWHIFQNERAITLQFSPPEVEGLERQRNTEKVLCEHLDKPYKKESVLDEFINQ